MDGIEIARHWRLKQQRYQLIGDICPQCESKSLMPRPVCPNCSVETVKKTLTYEVAKRQDIKSLFVKESLYINN